MIFKKQEKEILLNLINNEKKDIIEYMETINSEIYKFPFLHDYWDNLTDAEYKLMGYE